MTLDVFLTLDHQSRLVVLRDAVCIGKRKDGKFTVLLYQVNSFYVEVFHHKKYNRVSGMYSFDDVDKLTPYLSEIDIEFSGICKPRW